MRRALVALSCAAALLCAPAAAAARCPERLPVRAAPLTANASAFQRLAVVRVTPAGGARVSDLRVTVRQGGRQVAAGTARARLAARAAGGRQVAAGAARSRVAVGAAGVRQVAAGAATVRVPLAFRGRLRAGRAELVVTGRVAGCAGRRVVRRRAAVDARALPVSLLASGAGSDGLAVTLGATGVVHDLAARLLDATGAPVAVAARRPTFSTRAQLTFATTPPPGRYWLLADARVRGDARRRVFLAPVDIAAQRAAAQPAAPTPPPGAVAQTVSLGWSGGRWAGHDSAAFSIPGIGDGQLVCRPDTQWLRVFPADRGRDAAMLLWTARTWDGGGEVAIRESAMTPFTGPDFNEGLNKFEPAEKHSSGSFRGVVGGAGLPPTAIDVTWSWDFSDPGNAACSVSATLTSEGAGTTGAIARGLSLAWTGSAPEPDATTTVPGLGTVRLRCDPTRDGVRALLIDGAGDLAVTTYQGSLSEQRLVADAVPLPLNGLVEAVAPNGARLLVASRWKVDDPDPAENFCRIWGLATVGG